MKIKCWKMCALLEGAKYLLCVDMLAFGCLWGGGTEDQAQALMRPDLGNTCWTFLCKSCTSLVLPLGHAKLLQTRCHDSLSHTDLFAFVIVHDPLNYFAGHCWSNCRVDFSQYASSCLQYVTGFAGEVRLT
eukprot:1414847-Amphidinium_carterae.1